jgi:hypothetical protein
MIDNLPSKIAVSVSDMARMVGLSRARFYQLMKAGVFPLPLRDVSKKRPFYDQKMQETCLEVRRRNCGINGEPVLFYARRQATMSAPTKPRKSPQPKQGDHSDLTDSLKALGLIVTDAQIGAALQAVYPQGCDGIPEAEVIRAVFLSIKRQNSSGNVR